MTNLYSAYGISKQSHWKRVKEDEVIASKELLYIGLIEQMRELHPGMGLRKMYNQLSPEGIGRDAFVALGLHHGYRLRSVMVAHKTTRSVKSASYKNLLIDKRFTGVNQIWVSDLFYFPIGNKDYYVVLIMDVYSRRIVGYSAADNMRAENNIHALNRALTLRGIDSYGFSLIHHSDRGSQYTSNDYTDLLTDFEIGISMCTNVLENAHCERVNGTIKNEYLKRRNITSFAQLKQQLEIDIDNYNNRYHNSIKMTPIQYEDNINQLAVEQRPEMQIFTINKSLENSAQLELFNGSTFH